MRLVLGNRSLAGYPTGGGHWTYFLQYLLGLDALGVDLLLLELLPTTGDDARDQEFIRIFFERLEEYGFAGRSALLLYGRKEDLFFLERGEAYGKTQAEIKAFIGSADLLWNFASAIAQPMLSLFRRRVFLDGDPGHLQVSAHVYGLDMGQHDHDVYFTVGSKVGDPDCGVPTLGRVWHRFPQFAFLPMWPVLPDPGSQAPFTSITHWKWGEELWLDGREISVSKRDAYLRYLDLPKHAHRPFELAINLHPEDATGDRELLQGGGWRLVHPYDVAVTPAAYRDFIQRSRAELSCPKPIYRELKTGWLSDRSACYLASGRPVLAEETGFSDHFPTGNGLVAFKNLEEAVAGVAEIDGNYAHHSRAARAFAEEYLDAPRCLQKMLDLCGA